MNNDDPVCADEDGVRVLPLNCFSGSGSGRDGVTASYPVPAAVLQDSGPPGGSAGCGASVSRAAGPEARPSN